MSRRRKSESPIAKIIMAVVLVVLVIVLAVIISFAVKNKSASVEAEATVTAAQEADAVSAEEAAAAEAAAAAERERLAEEERAKKEAERKELSFYQKLKNGHDVNMLIMGDTVISGEGASSEDTTWFARLAAHVKEKYSSNLNVTNIAGSGNSLFVGYIEANELDDGVDYDLAVLCFGFDDGYKNFGTYFEAIVRALHEKYPDCAIIAVVEATEGGYTDKMIQMKYVCEHYDIPIADTFEKQYADYGMNNFFDAFSSDYIHPNDEGHQIYCDVIAKVIDDNVEADTGKMEEHEIYNLGVVSYANLKFIPASTFTRTDDLTYTYTVGESGDALKGTLLMSCNFPVVREDAKLVSDDILYHMPKETPYSPPDGRYILVIHWDFLVENSMQISFADKARADEFNGIYLMWPDPAESASAAS